AINIRFERPALLLSLTKSRSLEHRRNRPTSHSPERMDRSIFRVGDAVYLFFSIIRQHKSQAISSFLDQRMANVTVKTEPDVGAGFMPGRPNDSSAFRSETCAFGARAGIKPGLHLVPFSLYM